MIRAASLEEVLNWVADLNERKTGARAESAEFIRGAEAAEASGHIERGPIFEGATDSPNRRYWWLTDLGREELASLRNSPAPSR